MRGLSGIAAIGLASCLSLLGSCGGSDSTIQDLPAQPRQAPPQAVTIPELAGLDGLHGLSAIADHQIPVTEPIAQRHTQVAGESLEFIPPADELAYALYRIDPPGPPLTLSAAGEGPLWLLVADYGAGKWMMEPFVDGYAEIDLTELEGLFSPDAYMYSAVICPAGEAGRLDSMTLDYDLPDWNLTIWADEDSISLEWNELDFDNYIVSRSTLPDDQAPYEVASRFEAHSGTNQVVEQVPTSGPSGRWVPENNENSTPWDRSDDFPKIAPAVDYYYRVIPVLDGHRYAPSPEVTAEVDWGERRNTRREWPDTTDQSLLYGRWMDGGRMTAAQLQWCAENMIGATGFLQSELDYIRGFNPDFISLGAHWADLSSSNYQNITTYRHNANGDWVQFLAQFYGNEEDIDGAFPYIDKHEGWFIHDELSEKYNQRCTNGWDDGESYAFCYWMDLDGRWPAYVDTNLRQLLGEDCYDGWQLDGSHSNWVASPEFYDGQGYQGLYEYLYPRLTGLFTTAGVGAEAHSLKPYVFAEIFRGWSAGSGTYGSPALDISACGGIIVSRFLDDYRGVENRIWEFTDSMGDMILGWQSDDKPVILQSISRGSDYDHTSMVEYCCYLLVRGQRTYFYATPDPSFSRAVYDNPYWYPMYTWESGAPLEGSVTGMEDITVDYGGWTEYYRRDFENGFVVVMPLNQDYYVNDDKYYEYLECTGGGKVLEDGSVSGNAIWKPMREGSGLPGFAMWGPGRGSCAKFRSST